MQEELIEKHLQRLKNLKQYKEISEEELLRLAKKKANEELANIDSLVSDPKEKRLAKKLLTKYLDDFDIDDISDRNTLNALILLEIIHSRLQQFMNEKHAESEGAVPLHTLEAMHKNLDKIADLKNKLGINKKQEQQDPLKVLNTLKKRFAKYINEYRDDFITKCWKCGEVILLRRKTKDYKSGKYPFLKGNVLYNKPLLKLVVDKKITAQEAAEIMDTSSDGINWIIKEHYLKEVNGS